jgi:hypothetical protein
MDSSGKHGKKTGYVVKFRGEVFYLINRNGKLYLRLQRYGKPIWKSLRTTQKATAIERAKKFLLELERNNWMPPKKDHQNEPKDSDNPTTRVPKTSSSATEDYEPEEKFDYLYELAVSNVKKLEPRAFDSRRSTRSNASVRTESFPQSVRRAIIERGLKDADVESVDPDYRKVLQEDWEGWKPSFRPDLWLIDEEKQLIVLFEIEDTSLLKNKKLAKLVDFWWFMDNEGWSVECIVFDRYGLNPRPIHLQNLAYAHMEKNPAPDEIIELLGPSVGYPLHPESEKG